MVRINEHSPEREIYNLRNKNYFNNQLFFIIIFIFLMKLILNNYL